MINHPGLPQNATDHQEVPTTGALPNWSMIAEQWHGDRPHPDAPAIKVKDYANAVKMATRAKFGGHATAVEAQAFWLEFQTANNKLETQGKDPISPDEFNQLTDHLAPLSFVYHNRPPTMHEMVKLREATPAQVRQHYQDLPDAHYPDVPAGQMVKMLKAAAPAAQQYLGRAPVKYEAAYLHHSGQAPETYYQQISQAQGMPQSQEVQGGVPAQGGGVAGGGGTASLGGPQAGA